jgi:transposase
LATIPGIGPIIATAMAAMVAEPSGFRSGREFAAWLGLVPRQNSTGGKTRSSNLVGCWTGSSAGFEPLRICPTKAR